MLKIHVKEGQFVKAHGKFVVDFESFKIPLPVQTDCVEEVHGKTLIDPSDENILFVFLVNVV